MTAPSSQPSQPQPSGDPGRGGGSSTMLTAVVLLVLSAAVVFWAGLSLGSQTTGRDADERAALEAFSETYRSITDDFIGSPAPERLLEGAIEGMFGVLEDPFSRYMSPDEYQAALEDARGEFEGIGAVMATENAAGETCEVIDTTCRLRVVEVLPDAPAKEAGLLAEDVVTGVDGEPLAGRTIDDSVLLIRGPRGTDVVLSLDRDGGERTLTITRDTVVNEDVHALALADERIGYIGIDNFSSNAPEDVERELRGHLDAGIDKLIIDVRGDPGGFVDATVAISSEFIAEGPVFWEEDAAGQQVSVDASGDGLATDTAIDVIVLVDGGTASASEILAGALQDAGRATVVGERTFGKGTVQEWSELPGEHGGFRLSVAKWLTRDKTWVDGTGVIPDVPVGGTGERFWAGSGEADPSDDDQLQAAVALLLGEPLPAPRGVDQALRTPIPSAEPVASPSVPPSPLPVGSGEPTT